MSRIPSNVMNKLESRDYLIKELENRTCADIAKNLNIDITTFYKYCKIAGVSTNPIKRDIREFLEDRDRLSSALEDESLTSLSKRLGVSRTLLKKYCNIHELDNGSLPKRVLRKLEDKKWLREQTDNKTFTHIAENLKVARGTVVAYCKKHGIPISRLSHDAANILQNPALLREMVARNSLSEIARQLEINVTTMSNYCKRYDIAVHYLDQAIMDKLLDRDYLTDLLDNNSLQQSADEIGISRVTLSKYCKIQNISIPKSCYEGEIAAWLRECEIDFLQNNRDIIRPLELDFVFPDHKLAIEFNGLYWHSNRFVSNDYHSEKLRAARDAGYSLIMINEDEWLERASAIKSMIMHRMGFGEKGIMARKMSISKISVKEANDFFSQHHIQGSTSSSIIYALGGFHDGIMVCAMAFNKQRGTGEIELIRFCSDGRAHAGAFSRLFAHATKSEKFDKIISFADFRYSNGDVYFGNGFTKVKEISPDYRYIVGNKAVHKSNFTKRRIASRFKIDMSALTEREAMESLGFYRIYDCGKIKFIWERSF